MTHLEVLVEELSCERVLQVLLPWLVQDATFAVHAFNGKPDLLRNLPQRLRGYAQTAKSFDLKVVVLLDRDDENCRELKSKVEVHMQRIGLVTLTTSNDDRSAGGCTRIICEELEAWFFGDVPALRTVYPRVPETLERQRRFRDPDAIRGGTAEALEKLLADHGYGPTLAKVATADAIAPHMDVDNNRSASFQAFRDGVRRLVNEQGAT